MRKTAALLAVSMALILGACATHNNEAKLTQEDRAKNLQELEDARQSAIQHLQRESLMTSRGVDTVKASDQKAQVSRPE